MQFDLLIGDLIRESCSAQRTSVNTLWHELLLEWRAGQDRLPHNPVFPRDRCAICIDGGRQRVMVSRSIVGALNIILARPDDLHWPLHGLRQLNRFAHEVS